MQRTEVLEAEEFFSAGQKGSSAMPHKRNPVLTENLTGLARLVRGMVIPALENVALPLQIGAVKAARGQAEALLTEVGLGERLSHLPRQLSGGEQQMLAIGRAMMSQPQLLLVDELSLGLMPKIIDICYEAISELKRKGLTILLIEQSTQRALEVADHVCVLESGKTVWKDTAEKARDNADVIDALLGLQEKGMP